MQDLYTVQIQPRAHELDHADHTVPTRQHGLDHTDNANRGSIYLPSRCDEYVKQLRKSATKSWRWRLLSMCWKQERRSVSKENAWLNGQIVTVSKASDKSVPPALTHVPRGMRDQMVSNDLRQATNQYPPPPMGAFPPPMNPPVGLASVGNDTVKLLIDNGGTVFLYFCFWRSVTAGN